MGWMIPSLKSVKHILICIMKFARVIPCLKKIQKYINRMTHCLSSAHLIIFSQEMSNSCYIKKCRYKLHFNTKLPILLTFFYFTKFVSIKMVITLMMSAKFINLAFLKADLMPKLYPCFYGRLFLTV